MLKDAPPRAEASRKPGNTWIAVGIDVTKTGGLVARQMAESASGRMPTEYI